MTQHGGLALSYLNLYDADAAWLLVHDLGVPVRRAGRGHHQARQPLRGGGRPTPADAYQLAFECDERSAFGGIVAVSQVVDEATVERMVAAAQADVVIAPGYEPGTIEALQAKRKNTRILEAPAPTPDGGTCGPHRRPAGAGSPPVRGRAARLARGHPAAAHRGRVERRRAGLAGVRLGPLQRHRPGQGRHGVGIGAGQQNRVESGELAASKAAGRAAGGACASDAFYPFPDGIDAAAAAGVAVVIQPGRPTGVSRDEEIIARADELGLAMVFTGERHFLH